MDRLVESQVFTTGVGTNHHGRRGDRAVEENLGVGESLESAGVYWFDRFAIGRDAPVGRVGECYVGPLEHEGNLTFKLVLDKQIIGVEERDEPPPRKVHTEVSAGRGAEVLGLPNVPDTMVLERQISQRLGGRPIDKDELEVAKGLI